MTTEERLKEAIGTGEILKVIYQGGSQPGSLREISPISIKDGKVRARCFSSNAVKLFVLEKIEIVESEGEREADKWQPGLKPTAHYQSIRTLLEEKRDFLASLGWYIENDSASLSLHRRFKNGKPLKGSDVSLDYEEYTCDLVAGDGEVHEENRRKRQRPWTVRGKNKNTRTFGSLDKAAEVFLEWAKLLAPTHPQ